MTSYLALAPRSLTLSQLNNKNVKTIYSYASKTKRNIASRAVYRHSQMFKLLQMSLFQTMIHLTQTPTSVIKSSLLSRLHQWPRNHHISNKLFHHSSLTGNTRQT